MQSGQHRSVVKRIRKQPAIQIESRQHGSPRDGLDETRKCAVSGEASPVAGAQTAIEKDEVRVEPARLGGTLAKIENVECKHQCPLVRSRWARSGSPARLRSFWLSQPLPEPMTHFRCGSWVDDGVVIAEDCPSAKPGRIFFPLAGTADDSAECSWPDLREVTVQSMVRQMVRDERAPVPAPPTSWQVGQIAADSDRVLRDGSVRPLIRARQQTAAGRRMQPELLRQGLQTYPDLLRLINVAQGMIIPKMPGFEAAPQRPLSKAYRTGKAPLIHARVAKDHEAGHVLLLNSKAAALVRRVDGVNEAPLGHTPKRGEPPPRLGRVTTNASAGTGGGYQGSLNACTDQELVRHMYGRADVTPVGTVARMCNALDEQGRAVAVATADAKGAFNRVDQEVEAACDMVSSLDPALAGKCSSGLDRAGLPAMSLSLVCMFGGTATPAAWHVVQRAICWIVDTQPLDWWVHGFENWRAAQPRTESRPGPVGDVLQSMLAAMAYVLCPRDPDRIALNAGKIVGPGRRRVYAGWVIDCVGKRVSLSRRGVLKMAYALYQQLPRRAQAYEYEQLRSATHVLLHYASLRPAAQAFLGEMWRLLKVHGARRGEIAPTPTLEEDLAWWRAVLDVIWKGGDSLSVPWAETAGRLSPCVQPETDASGFGGGLYVPAHCSPPRARQPARSWRLEWTEAELTRLRLAGDTVHINVLEYAVFVFALLIVGPTVRSMGTLIDNTTAVSWARKGRAKAPAAHDLARVAALAEFAFGGTARTATGTYLKGELQLVADPLSRWNEPERRQAYRSFQPPLPGPVLVTLRAKGRAGRARRLLHGAITGTLRQQPGWLGRVAGRLYGGW